MFSHPADYTPVCTTELARVIELVPEFKKRNVKLIAISCDSVDDHLGWSKVISNRLAHFITESAFCFEVSLSSKPNILSVLK